MPAVRRDPDRTRAAILASTVDLIGTHGFESIRHRTVATAAGVSLGSVPNHFPTREDLQSSALQYLSITERDRLNQWALALQATALDFDEWIARIAHDVALDVENNRARWLALIELQLACARHEELRPAMETLRNSYRTVLTLGFRAAGFSDPTSAADQAIAAVTGLILKYLAYPSDDFPLQLQTLVATLVGGMKEQHLRRD